MKRLEMVHFAWFAKDFENKGEQIQNLYLGEAGTTGYPEEHYVKAIRMGDEVIVSCRKNDSNTIPADMPVKGFGNLDEKTLKEIMEENVIYDYNLKKVI